VEATLDDRQTSAPTVSIVVLGWRSAPLLVACLRWIEQVDRSVSFEVIVTLNEPTSDLLSKLASSSLDIRIVSAHGNAINYGSMSGHALNAPINTSWRLRTARATGWSLPAGGPSPWAMLGSTDRRATCASTHRLSTLHRPLMARAIGWSHRMAASSRSGTPSSTDPWEAST
jgi:hypothetical protein